MKSKEYKLNSIVEMKKPHPCGNNVWEIIRVGVDIKIKCSKCDRSIMLSKLEFEKKLKRVINH